MFPLLPEGTTWFDIVTLAIAVLALYLTVRRDRRIEQVKVRVTTFLNPSPLRYGSGGRDLGIRLSNQARRTVTVERAGLSVNERVEAAFEGFRQVNHRMSAGGSMSLSDPPLPKTLEPGDPAYIVNAPMHVVRRAFFREPPKWAWAEDTYGTVYWGRISRDLRGEVASTKRRKQVEDAMGGYSEVEIEDDEPA